MSSSLIAKIAALVLSLSPESKIDNSLCYKNCVTGDKGLSLIRTFEGYSPFPYICPAGYLTVGYGHVILEGEKFDTALLPEQADNLLRKDLKKFEKNVNNYVVVHLKQTQADALISFTYNLGGNALKKSTLLKKVNAELHTEVPEQFMRWTRAKGKVLQGLVNRRKAEAELYKL